MIIIRLKKKLGWSQEELADKMNVFRQAVSMWEGTQTVPDLGKVLLLSQLFGVTTDRSDRRNQGVSKRIIGT